MANMGKYEAVIIINATLDDSAIEDTINRVKNLIGDHGTLDAIDDWGKRKLAYPIDDMMEGYYVLLNFTAPKEFPAELDRICNISDAVIRSLIVAKEEEEQK